MGLSLPLFLLDCRESTGEELPRLVTDPTSFSEMELLETWKKIFHYPRTCHSSDHIQKIEEPINGAAATFTGGVGLFFAS